MNFITVQELAGRHNNADVPQMIDVRSAGEYQTGHLPGAVNIPMEQIAARRGDLPKQGEIVIVCQRGQRAAMVYEQLHPSFPQMRVLAGGTSGWQEAKLPVVGWQTASWSIERQIRLIAGALVLLGTLVGLVWKPALGLAIFIGGGLVFSALANWCGMGLLLAKMPWNQPVTPKTNPLSEHKITGEIR